VGILINISHQSYFGGIMVYVHVDEKARICLTKEIVEQYGKEFALVPAKNEIILIPISKDPLKSLQAEGKKIPKHLTVADLKKMAREEAEKEALTHLKKNR